MKFKKGDRVKFLNSVDEGVIVNVIGARVEVEDEHGFIVEVSENEVVNQKIEWDNLHLSHDEDIDQKRQIDAPNGLGKIDVNFSSKKGRTDKKVILEVDLHINELIDRTAHLTNFQIVTIQMGHFREMLALARKNRYQKIVFIHGVGEGVLRSEIREELKEEPNCGYVDADFSQYGQGATEVNLWYN